MSRNLLFISKYPDIVQEFLDAMQGQEIEIDTASNGNLAAANLKKKNYQVVVTGLSLDGYNGEQIITYLNRNFPNTVCIIYTTTITPAQLYFFINERDVFRVFLRPVDFRGEFFQALEEAYEYYDVRMKEQEEAADMTVEMEKKKRECQAIEKRLALWEKERDGMCRYIKRLTALSLQDEKELAAAEEKKKLEWEIADLCTAPDEKGQESLARAGECLERLKQLTKEEP